MSRDGKTYPAKRRGTCVECGHAVRQSHGWLDIEGVLRHHTSCWPYRAADAHNLLKRIAEALEDGSIDIPDVAHAIETEIAEELA